LSYKARKVGVLKVDRKNVFLKFFDVFDNKRGPPGCPSNDSRIVLIFQDIVSFLNKITDGFGIFFSYKLHA
jgi:hypothetical protein